MNAHQWAQVKAALAQVMEATDPEHAVGSIQDPLIRDEVARLWLAREDMGAFLEPKVAVADGPLVAELERALGQGYCNFRQIGHGGSSLVLQARQTEPVMRDVAIKVTDGRLVHQSVRQRFQMERESLASLNHPHIAVIHSAGETDNGYLYLVMEWIDGQPITEYCDHHRLTIAERLRLFLQVTHAVQFAHQNGILHRDLKPSNIMVVHSATGPHAKVIDFGIATRLDDDDEPRVTRELGAFPGTLPYVAPERLKDPHATPNTQTDVFALGVVLFELATGRRPFEGSSTFDLAQKVMKRDPPRPSRLVRQFADDSAVARARQTGVDGLARSLRTDLDWIINRSIDRDPQRRYATVVELTQDLERERQGRPVHARPPDWLYVIRKFSKRHRASVIAGLIVFSVLVGSSIGLYWLYRRSETARFAEIKARQKQELETKRARAIAQFLEDMLRSPDPSHLGEEARVIDFLARSAETVEATFADDPLTLAQVHISLGDTYLNLGIYEQAETHYVRALELQGEAGEATVRMLNKLGRHAIHVTHYSAARDYLDRAKTLSINELGSLHEMTLTIRYNLATIDEETGNPTAAMAQLLELQPLIEKQDPRDDQLYFGCLTALARLRADQGEFEQAVQSLRTVLQQQTQLLGERHPETLTTLFDLGKVLRKQGNYAQAEEIQRREWALSIDVMGEQHPETLVSLEGLVHTLISQKKYDTALPLARQCYHSFVDVLGKDHAFTAFGAANYAQLLAEQGEIDDADRLFREAIDIASRSSYDDQASLNRFKSIYARYQLAWDRDMGQPADH